MQNQSTHSITVRRRLGADHSSRKRWNELLSLVRTLARRACRPALLGGVTPDSRSTALTTCSAAAARPLLSRKRGDSGRARRRMKMLKGGEGTQEEGHSPAVLGDDEVGDYSGQHPAVGPEALENYQHPTPPPGGGELTHQSAGDRQLAP